MRTTPRRVAALAAGPALSLVLAAGLLPAHADSSPSSTLGAGWLTRQLTNGLVHNDQYDFDDYGLTVDTGLALASIGGQDASVQAIRNAFAGHVNDYTEPGFGTNVSAGGTAKALRLAEVTGANPRSFGGVDLVSRLEQRVGSNGRISDDVDTTQQGAADYANTIGQAFAVQSLAAVGDAKTTVATTYLLQQQCPAGFFRLSFPAAGATDQPCTANPADVPGPDVTALAVLALRDQLGNATVAAAVGRAVAWMKSVQAADGSFTDGTVANTNSTGLAATALGTTCATAEADRAAAWVRGLQVPSGETGALATQTGAIAYNAAALTTGRAQGIKPATRDQWRRASSQAAPALSWDPTATPTLSLTGPQGYQRAGRAVNVTVTGASTLGTSYCFAADGVATPQTLVGGSAVRTLTLPATTGTSTYTATTGPGLATLKVSYLAPTKLRLKLDRRVARGDKERVKVRGLAPQEKVRVFVGKHHRVARATANARGVAVLKFLVHAKPGRLKVLVKGQFGTRTGATKIRVVR